MLSIKSIASSNVLKIRRNKSFGYFLFLKFPHGFTLIELLVVIAIIGILAAVVTLAIDPVKMMQKSRDSRRKSDITNLAKAITIHIANTMLGNVPGGANQTRYSYYTGTTQTCCDGDSGSVELCSVALSARTTYGGWLVVDSAFCAGTNMGNYIPKIPSDPNGHDNGSSYEYITDPTGTKFSLCVDLEYDGDSSEVFKQGTDISYCTLTSTSR